MARRVEVADIVHEVGLLELPWDVEAGRVDPVFEVTVEDVQAMIGGLAEPDCSATLADLEAALVGVRTLFPTS